MTSIWTGRKVRLRGIEPEDWRAFMSFDQYTADMQRVENIHPPRSEGRLREREYFAGRHHDLVVMGDDNG